MLAIEWLELSIFALLARRSNRLSYMALHFTLFWVLVFVQFQINIMASNNIGYRKARTLDLSTASTKL